LHFGPGCCPRGGRPRPPQGLAGGALNAGVRHRNALPVGHDLNWYRIDGILGQGGFGITYLAYDANLDESVAIKEYLPVELAVRDADCSVQPVSSDHDGHYSWGLERFIAEARTVTRLRHPSIVRVRAVFEANNTAYMVMDYESGDSLADVLSRRRTLSESELTAIAAPLLEGLTCVHAAGFIHRDIKPANLFLRRDGTPVLLDFGSARQALFGETRTLTTLVSPGYAPFEQYQAKSDKQGPWTDIYALGATFYRAVTGTTPMDAIERSEADMSGEVAMKSAERAGSGYYARSFLRAIDHALAMRPGDRPQTVAAWRAELFADGEPRDRQADVATETAAVAGARASGVVQSGEQTAAVSDAGIDLSIDEIEDAAPARGRLRRVVLRHWKSKLGAGLLGLVLSGGNPVVMGLAMVVVHFFAPKRWVWITILCLLTIVIGLAIINDAANKQQVGSSAPPAGEQSAAQ